MRSDGRFEADMVRQVHRHAQYTITASAGIGGTISPSGAVVVNYGGSQAFTISANGGYSISNVQIDGISVGVCSSYTFTSVTASHTISATFVSTGFTITASAGTGGTIAPSGAVKVPIGGNQTFTITPNTGYGIASVTVDTVNQGSINSYTFTNVQANHTIVAAFTALGRNVPKSDQLLFSTVTESLPSSGSTGNWPIFWPTGGSLTMIGSPTVDTLGGKKWEHNNRITSYDGFRFGSGSTSPIPVNGVTIIAAVKPTYCSPGGEPRGEVVDIFYGDLFLAVGHTDGQVIVCRRSYQQFNTGYFIPDGQMTLLSLVVSSTGNITLYANGTQKWSQASGVDYTTLQPGTETFKHYIDVGRNDPDGWSAFNGNIGDVFVYKVALSDTDRGTLESDIRTKFGF